MGVRADSKTTRCSWPPNVRQALRCSSVRQALVDNKHHTIIIARPHIARKHGKHMRVDL